MVRDCLYVGRFLCYTIGMTSQQNQDAQSYETRIDLLWPELCSAHFNVTQAANTKTRDIRTSYHDGLMMAYSIMAEMKLETVIEKLDKMYNSRE